MRLTSPASLLLISGALLAIAGCKYMEQPVQARTDTQIAGDIQSKLTSDMALNDANNSEIHVAVNNGVATLDGTAPDDNTRLQAATEASKVTGVKEVVNDLSLPETADATQSCVAPKRAHHHIKALQYRAPEVARAEVAPPAPAPVAPPPMYAAAPAPMAVMPPPPLMIAPVRPVYGYGYYGPRYVRPVRPYAYYRRPAVGVYVR